MRVHSEPKCSGLRFFLRYLACCVRLSSTSSFIGVIVLTYDNCCVRDDTFPNTVDRASYFANKLQATGEFLISRVLEVAEFIYSQVP